MDNRILLVDDEESIRKFLRISLQAHGYQVLEAACGADAVELIQKEKPDAVILDMGLPDVSGLDVTRAVRSWSWVPILFLSVVDQERTKVEALEAGADDYMVKPFGLQELLARLKAALRRKMVVPTQGPLAYGDISMNIERRLVTVAERAVSLTPTEFSLLHVLLRQPERVVHHRDLLNEVWGPAYVEELQLLRVNVSNLRKKIEGKTTTPERILNEPGVGYRLSCPSMSSKQP
ncbi:MAG: response regulator transcription factor [Vulcanimicrobiota bacterium]